MTAQHMQLSPLWTTLVLNAGAYSGLYLYAFVHLRDAEQWLNTYPRRTGLKRYPLFQTLRPDH